MPTTNNDTKQRIIDEMYHLIAKYGCDKASLSKLCKAVGITKPSIYYYFESKEDILLAVLNDMYVVIDHNDDIDDAKNPREYREKLLALGDKIISDFHDDAERQAVLAEMDLQSTRIPALAECKISLAGRTVESFESVLQHGVKIGALAPDFDVNTAAQYFYTLIAGMSQTVASKDDINERAIWAWMVDALLRP